MASILTPRIHTFNAGAAISKGMAVKLSSGNVVKGAANTDKCIGIAQNAPEASGDKCEVAMPGGGAKALAGETIEAGRYLVSHTDGSLVKANAEGDHVIAFSLESAVANDLFSVDVVMFTAHAAEA